MSNWIKLKNKKIRSKKNDPKTTKFLNKHWFYNCEYQIITNLEGDKLFDIDESDLIGIQFSIQQIPTPIVKFTKSEIKDLIKSLEKTIK